MPAFDEEFDDLAELGTRPVTHLVDGAAQLTPRIEVLPAPGHTPGDLIVLVADVDVCFAGDLCFFGVTPLAFQGDPAMWADVLDAVVELADVIVPGHGPVGGEAEVRDLQGYLRRVRRRQGRRRRDPARPVGRAGSTATATPSTSSAPRCSRAATTCIPPVDAQGDRPGLSQSRGDLFHVLAEEARRVRAEGDARSPPRRAPRAGGGW